MNILVCRKTLKLIEKKMFSPKFLPVVVVALWLSVPDFHFEAYGDVIPSPTANCDPPCQQVSPPISGDPSYGAAPPPPSPPPSGYSIYGTPPPPPHEKSQSKCPPASGVQCCTPPNPYTYGPPNPYAPPNYNTYGPPNPYAPPNYNTFGPPNPYTNVPNGGGEGFSSMLLPILVPLMMLFSSFIFHF